MAKILLGATIGDARGSAGAIVYSKNRSGAYIRQKVSPVQPRTARQTLVRQLFSALAIYWGQSLDVAERAAWTALAATNPVTDVFGNSQILTGLQLFMRVNRNRQQLALAVLDAAPANQDVTPLSALSMTAVSATQVISVTHAPSPIPATHYLLVFGSPPLSPGVSFFKPLLKALSAVGPGVASPFDVSSAWIALYGAFSAGQRIGIKAVMINGDTGAASSDVFATAIAT